MRSRSRMMLVSWMMISLWLVVQWRTDQSIFRVAAAAAAAASCSGSSTDAILPDVINVAVLVWADSDEVVLSKPISSYAPIPLTSAGAATSAPSLTQPYYLGIEFYKTQLARVNGGRIPVQGGTRSVALNISYINLGRVNWNNIYSGYPFDGIMSSIAADMPGGLFDRLVYNASLFLGENRTFTFFVPHTFMGDFALPLFNRVEDDRLAVIVHPLVPTAETCICDGVTPSSASATPDCTALPYDRKRLLGARRFETMFSTLPDVSYDSFTTLDLMHTLGVKRVAMFRDARSSQVGSYSTRTMDRAIAYAGELNLEVVLTGVLEPFSPSQCSASGNWTDATNCPPVAVRSVQTQVWPNGTTATDWVRQLRDRAVDAVIVVATSGTPGAWAFADLIMAMRAMSWTPSMMSFVGAFEKYGILPFLPNGKGDLMLYMTGEIVWHPGLRGTDYQTQTTPTNFEVVESNTTHATPAVFTDLFNRMYGPACDPSMCVAPASAVNGTAHPFWNSNADGGTMSMIGFTAMVQAQKLIEAAGGTDNVPQILASASKIDAPSGFHRLAFDAHGQTREFPVEVTQYRSVADGSSALESTIVVPYNIGVPPVYPIPAWEDRTFAPQLYERPSEQVVIVLTTLAIIVVGLVLFFVWVNWSHSVIRASTSSFAILVAMGALMMLISNYPSMLHTTSSRCAAHAWLLTHGFTLMTASIAIKTYRIWRIFMGNLLTKVTMPNTTLYWAVAAFVSVDLLLNTLWQGLDGFKTKHVVVDPLRPRFDYIACDYSSSAATWIVWIHVGWKGAMLIIGAVLAIATRNVPTMFNDALMTASYNLFFIVSVFVPLVAAGVGNDREVTMLFAAFGVWAAALLTPLVLYIPKLYQIYKRSAVRHHAGGGGGNHHNNRSALGNNATQADNTNPTLSSHTISDKKKKMTSFKTQKPLLLVQSPLANGALPSIHGWVPEGVPEGVPERAERGPRGPPLTPPPPLPSIH